MITAKKCKVQTRSGVMPDHKEGLVACKIISLADVLSLLNTTGGNLCPMSGGDVIIGVDVHVNVPLGEAGVIDIGVDANLHSAADPDGLIDSANGNVADTLYSTSDTVADATAPTYCGALLDGGSHVCVGDGNLTIASSADNTDTSALTGSIKIWYLPG